MQWIESNLVDSVITVFLGWVFRCFVTRFWVDGCQTHLVQRICNSYCCHNPFHCKLQWPQIVVNTQCSTCFWRVWQGIEQSDYSSCKGLQLVHSLMRGRGSMLEVEEDNLSWMPSQAFCTLRDTLESLKLPKTKFNCMCSIIFTCSAACCGNGMVSLQMVNAHGTLRISRQALL